MATEIGTQTGSLSERKLGSIARFLPAAARIVMGLTFLVFGLNGFLHFIPNHQHMSAGAMAYLGALVQSGYMLPLIFTTEAVAGALLLANHFVPLALALIAPVVVNIVGFHSFLDRPHLVGPALVVLAAEIYLAWVYRRAFAPMLAAKPSFS